MVDVNGVSGKLLLHWAFPFVVTGKKASNYYLVRNEITDEVTDAAGPNMVRFGASVAAARAFKDLLDVVNEEATRATVARDRPLRQSEVAVGSVVALRDTEVDASNQFWLGRVLSLNAADNEIVVQYYATTMGGRNPVFALAWNVLEGRNKGLFMLQSVQPRRPRCEPWVGTDEFSNVVAVNLAFDNSGHLDADSRRVLRQFAPSALGRIGS